MGDVNHLYCSRHSPVIEGFWISLCAEFGTAPKRLATTSGWDNGCYECGGVARSHQGLGCHVRCLGFVFESEMQKAIEPS